jgi:hypothetical protein
MLDCVHAGDLHFSAHGDLGVTSSAIVVVHRQNANMRDDMEPVSRMMGGDRRCVREIEVTRPSCSVVEYKVKRSNENA